MTSEVDGRLLDTHIISTSLRSTNSSADSEVSELAMNHLAEREGGTVPLHTESSHHHLRPRDLHEQSRVASDAGEEICRQGLEQRVAQQRAIRGEIES